MKEVVKKEILYDLKKAIEILKVKEAHDPEELKELSDHAIEDVATHKDLDLVAVTVLLYSLYKTVETLNDDNLKRILKHLQIAVSALEKRQFGKYNGSIRLIFRVIKTATAKVKEHLQDVMQAAKIKKGSILLQRGLSIGQAAGLMGLSNWDLQAYAGSTMALSHHREAVPAKKRLATALKVFGI